MSLEAVFTQVEELQRLSRAHTQRARFQAACESLKEAINLLERRLQRSEVKDGESGTNVRLAAILADTYGRLGGVYRRTGDLEQAVEAYRRGSKIEQDPAFGLINSYNSTNTLVIDFLLSPWPTEDRRHKLRMALDATRKQAEGPRRRDWWAWADVATLSVILGDADGAGSAFKEFQEAGARRADVDSVMPVLSEINRVASGVDDGVAEASRQMMALLESTSHER